MKKNFIMRSLFLLIILFGFLGVKTTAYAGQAKFKVVGYLPDYDMIHRDATINFKQLTDVNYFSVVPEATGKLKFTENGSAEQLKELVKDAHKEKVKVGVSLGGWGLSDNFAEATSDTNRKQFIASVVDFVDRYNLDTVDIDWEYPDQDKAPQFEAFVKELKKELKTKLDGTIKVSICVPTGIGSNGLPTGTWEDHFTPAALNAADWINIMSYDAQMPGFPNHSPVDLQKNALNYWNDLMGGDKMAHLVAGMPYYAKALNETVITYNSLVDVFEGVLTNDEATYMGETFYFNNKETVQTKTQDSIKLGSLGVMIWTPTQDANLGSPSRLTDVIADTIADSNKVELDKDIPVAEVAIDNVIEKVKEGKSVNKWLLVSLLMLMVISLLLFRGHLPFLLPSQIKGRKVDKINLGKLVGLILLTVSVLAFIIVVLPWYLSLLIFVGLGAGGYYILK
ncbi:glycosyl hydrolase family 18 protein [Vagococcus intermedius]|uniref:chitinase n=1 Tax=Vagococcus intermedius TaxID=2991418 RepID=A0AAF0I7X3_9ENTE|nr:glycosyl hydrolase family 18 protein [Vagococcus intermedius]WEG73664.1 glycosyl hydrolase family 18 protein [Vagococcus intermedius]WEG75748.1 glycosyl hydrolase family 18 protein [Vagococcus intermedius]